MSNISAARTQISTMTDHVHSQKHNANAVVPVEDFDRLRALKVLKQDVPRDNCNLPIFLYRIDLIQDDTLEAASLRPHLEGCTSEQLAEVEQARMQIVWEEGFPALEDGSALWGKWVFEDQTIHECFLEYLELSRHIGMRSINDLALLGESSSRLGRDRLYEAYVCYYWDDRARAYDLYERIRQRRLREKRILSTNDRHFLTTESLISALYKQYFEKIDEDTGEFVWIEDLTPKDAIKALETLTKIQRDALGVHTSGSKSNSSEDEESLDTPEQIRGAMQDITTKTKRNDQRAEEDVLALLRDDDEAAEAAQALVIKMNQRGNRQATHDPNNNSQQFNTNTDPAGSAFSGGIPNIGPSPGASDGISAEDERRLQAQLARQQQQQQADDE